MKYLYLNELNVFSSVTIEDKDIKDGVVDFKGEFKDINPIIFGTSCFEYEGEKRCAIKEIIMPSNTAGIGKKAFSKIKCKEINLTRIECSSLINFSKDAFLGCSATVVVTDDLPNKILQMLPLARKTYWLPAHPSHKKLDISSLYSKTCIIGEGFESLHVGNDNAITNLILPKSLKSLSGKLPSISKINLENTTIEEVPEELFQQNKKMREISLPPTIKKIGARSFKGMGPLEISFENCCALKTIEDEAFLSTKISENIIFPNKLEYIGDNAFRYCGIKTIEFPPALCHIGNGCFMGNELTAVQLGKTAISEIGDYSFSENGITFFSLPPYCYSIGNEAFRYNNINVEKIEHILANINVGEDAFKNNI